MLFKVSRTSVLGRDIKTVKPCDEAVWSIHEIHVDVPINYRGMLVFGRSANAEKVEGWYVQIKDIEDLVAFANKHGELVFNGKEIEIYDDYRE